MTITLRPASLEDVSVLQHLSEHAFREAFGHLYDPADLKMFLDEHYAVSTVEREVAGTQCEHRLAWDDMALVGYCKLERPSGFSAYSDAAHPIALNQLYTDPAATGRGIGAALMKWALAYARDQGHDAMQLSVWSENARAQRFYKQYGFAHIADIDFYVGNHRDDEYLYELRL